MKVKYDGILDDEREADMLPDGSNSNINLLTFDTTPVATSTAEGQLRRNSTDGTLDLGMQGGTITQQIGQELFIKVINKTGVQIDNGSPVYISGRQGNRPKILLARSDSATTSDIIGMTTQDIADNDEGYVTTFGYVRQIKTDYLGAGNWGTTWAEGDNLYVSKTIAGQLTNVEPLAPHHSDIVGQVAIVGGAGIGSIFVSIQKHKTFQELSDVNGTPLATSGQIPVWNQAAGYFDFTSNITDYLYKPGLSGGQTAVGGTAITDKLVLQGTSGNGTLTSPAIQLNVGNNGTTNAMTVLNNGNIGVGTTSPSNISGFNGRALHINEDTNGYYGIVKVTGGGALGGAFFQQTNDASRSLYIGTYGSSNPIADLIGVVRANNSFIVTDSTAQLVLGTMGANNVTLGTNNTANVTIKSGGNVCIGTTSNLNADSTAKLDITGGGSADAKFSILIGADTGQTNLRTNNTNKVGRFGLVHYSNAQEPIGLVRGSSTSADNTVYIGGGSSLTNSATKISFFTGANTTTLTGTEVMTILSSGNVGIGTNNPLDKVHILTDTTGLTSSFRLTSSYTAGQVSNTWLSDAGGYGATMCVNRNPADGVFTGSAVGDPKYAVAIGMGGSLNTAMLSFVNRPGSVLTSQFTMLYTGFCGFKNTAPIYHVEIGDGTATNEQFRLYSSGTNGFSGFYLHNGTAVKCDIVSTSNAAVLATGGLIIETITAHPIVFRTSSTGAEGSGERMRILPAGNVGVGTNNPTYKFEVNGGTSDSTYAINSLFVRGTEAGGYGMNATFKNESTATNSVAILELQAGDNTHGGSFFGSRASIPGYGIADGITFRAYPGRDLGFTAGIAYDSTLTGPGMIFTSTGRFGIGYVASPSFDVSLGGNTANKTLGMERRTTANSTGLSLTILSGGATSGATDKNGGDLILSSATTTGNGSSNVVIKAVLINQGTGTTDRTATTMATFGNTAKLLLPAGSATAGTAPIKLTSGTLLATPESGTIEFDGVSFYFTI